MVVRRGFQISTCDSDPSWAGSQRGSFSAVKFHIFRFSSLPGGFWVPEREFHIVRFSSLPGGFLLGWVPERKFHIFRFSSLPGGFLRGEFSHIPLLLSPRRIPPGRIFRGVAESTQCGETERTPRGSRNVMYKLWDWTVMYTVGMLCDSDGDPWAGSQGGSFT